MKYQITGADKETGEDVSMVLDAASQEEAEAIARVRGVLISEVTPFDTRAAIDSKPVDGQRPPLGSKKKYGALVLVALFLVIAGAYAFVLSGSSVYGSAWVLRNSADSSILRGMPVYVYNKVASHELHIRLLDSVLSQYESEISTLELGISRQSYDIKSAEKKAANKSGYNRDIALIDIQHMRSLLKIDVDGLKAKKYFHSKHTAEREAAINSPTDAGVDLDELYFLWVQNRGHLADAVWSDITKELEVAGTYTNAQGEYELKVPRGQYYIHAKSDTKSIYIDWMVPVDVGFDENVVVDLYNDNARVIVNR